MPIAGPEGWSRHVANVLESINELDRLTKALLEAVDALTPNSRGRSGILIYTPRKTGQDIWCTPDPPEIYERAHHFDPFLAACFEGRFGCHALQDVSSPGFSESAFFESVYLGEGLCDEIVHSRSCGEAFILVGRVSETAFTDSEIALHHDASPIITAAAPHVARLVSETSQTRSFALGRSVEDAMDHFGGDVLTPREQDVVHLILRGHNTESITNRLGISPNTIKRHRSQAYQKLKVGSQGELFSRFLQLLGMPAEG